MSKLQDIRNLVQEHAVSVSSSPGDWMDYMDTASRLYRYSFSDQLLIHAQRPDATACASLEMLMNLMITLVQMLAENAGNISEFIVQHLHFTILNYLIFLIQSNMNVNHIAFRKWVNAILVNN